MTLEESVVGASKANRINNHFPVDVRSLASNLVFRHDLSDKPVFFVLNFNKNTPMDDAVFEISGIIRPSSNKNPCFVEVTKSLFATGGKKVAYPTTRHPGSGKRVLRSPHIDRLLLLVLESKLSNRSGLSLKETIWRAFNLGTKSPGVGEWMMLLFGNLKSFRELVPDPKDGLLKIGSQFSVDRLRVALSTSDGKQLSNLDARTLLWKLVGGNSERLAGPIRQKAIKIAVSDLQLHEIKDQNEDEELVLAGKIAWLYGLIDLERLMNVHLLSENGLLPSLVNELPKAGSAGNDILIIEWNVQVNKVIQLLEYYATKYAAETDFRIDDVKTAIYPVTGLTEKWLGLGKEKVADRRDMDREIISAARQAIDDIGLVQQGLTSGIVRCRRQVTRLLLEHRGKSRLPHPPLDSCEETV